MADPDFYTDTWAIRRWIRHETVSTDALVAELTEWADWFSSQVHDADADLNGGALIDGTGCGPAGSTVPADPHRGVDSA